ncbi:MAG: hypothetical protein ABSE63_07695 [Thermoguttaceae bacterium]
MPKLKTTYFSKIPTTNTIIWLLKNRESYENYVQKYGAPDHLLTAGYFSSQNHEIVMDAYHCYGPDIQSAILTQTVLSFKELCALKKKDFYQFDKERNYAQTQYLCYYLQEKGLLKKFYQTFKRNHRKDPTGYKTLQTVVQYKDMQEFQEDWKEFILTIPSPSETSW